jgi:hypothetical protein
MTIQPRLFCDGRGEEAPAFHREALQSRAADVMAILSLPPATWRAARWSDPAAAPKGARAPRGSGRQASAGAAGRS